MNHKGFTLIELMVSLFIAGILTGMLFPVFRTVYRRWDQEKLQKLAANTCEQIFEQLKTQVKFAENEEIEAILNGKVSEEAFHDLELQVETGVQTFAEEFLFLTVTVSSSDGAVICEKSGAAAAWNMTLEGEQDE